MKKLTLLVAALALTFGSKQALANNTTHSLLGVDVSNYQGSINWSSVYGDGVRFAVAKATESTGFTDAYFAGNMNNGKAAGLQMGAYHFAHPESTCPSAQANHFWSVAGSKITADGKSVYPTLDLEVFSGVACSEGTYTAWSNDWSTDVKAKTANFLHPVVYISACNCSHISTAITLSAWIADYNGQNLYTGNPWSTCCSYDRWGSTSCNANTWTYWQVSSTGAISGISGNVDLDAYNGTLSELISWQGV
ncbi:MAG: glycoside hydrolase family 25 protein [Limisphaerales bacterium]